MNSDDPDAVFRFYDNIADMDLQALLLSMISKYIRRVGVYYCAEFTSSMFIYCDSYTKNNISFEAVQLTLLSFQSKNNA
jgi:hypothetical protein